MAHATNPDSGPFSRSYSSPELQSLASSSSPRQSSRPFNQRPQLDKALPHIPSFDVPSFNSGFELDTSLFLKAKVPDNGGANPAAADQSKEDFSPRLRLAIPRSRTGNLTTERPKSWLHGLRSTKDTYTEEKQRPSTAAADYDTLPDDRNSPHAPSPRKGSLTTSTSEKSFTSFAKKSWISRTPSPKSAPTSPLTKVSGTRAESKLKAAKTPWSQERSVSPAKDSVPEDSSNKTTPKAFSRAGNYLAKIRPNKPSTLPTKGRDYADSDHSCASSATSLGGTGPQSIDSHTSQSTCGESNTTTPITDDSSSEMPPAVRDTLWSSFKTLENEYRGFPSKQVAQKIVQIQTLLVPFLRSTVNHHSIKSLQPEDVDRRATILNKWWSAVLEMLNSQTQPPVPGVDRPILLEAATMLMMRPEWRRTTSSYQPLTERSPTERIRTRSWTNSSESTFDSAESALLAESAEHSVRTMFISNLVKQMAIVVEKMSLRHAPLSLVNFAGKTCAYAFFFAPGVADVLIRLWGLTPELIRRVADEFHLPRKDSGESEDIVALFPPKLAGFGWTSPRTAWNTIKQVPKMTVLVARIPWTSPWVARWKGRDTDLFFIFCKYFHILSDQFMPPGLPLTEKARSPAFVFVQAQVLNIIDSTIHRQAALQHHNAPSMMDSVNGADASALPMPLPPSNIMKGMSENRAVVLLKDVLNDNSADNIHSRVTFAEAFSSLMMAATKRTSLFNNPACLTLCDFLEEVLAVYNDFEDAQGMQSLIDWNFWFDVCKKVMTSMNTMSEVRMLSFLFTIWSTAAKDPRRKTALCRDWLLTEETFNSLFNNWCPMVRAYYQRLLCWRICRDDGNATEADNEILLLATTRLKSVWAHYLYLKETANAQCRAGPSTAPMSPTLGKRFIIIRQEVNTLQPGLFMGFDTFARSSSSTSSLVPPVGFFDSSIPKTDSKKRWSLLGKVLSFTSGEDGPGADGLPRNKSFDDSLALARREVAENARNRPTAQTSMPTPTTPVKSSASSFGSEDSGGSTPVVDEQRYIFKFVLGWQQQQNAGSRERVLSTPRLPGPAQLRVGGRTSPQQYIRPVNGLRSVSGSSATGLIQNARNASPLASPVEEKVQDLTLIDGRLKDLESSSIHTTSKASSVSGWSDTTGTATPMGGRQAEQVEPAKPTGHFTRNTAYTGQALAEWGQVVSECNSFVTRRQDEGITRLCEVEVPQLGVEGFRRLGG